MKIALVGYTGFVGGNICAAHQFDALYNSKNIAEAYGTNPDVLIYAGVKAEMFTANIYPEKDMEMIRLAEENILKIAPKKLVLLSTISVYNSFEGVSEDTIIDETKLLPYGKNRLSLENWVKDNFTDYLIVRLPALYGKGIKKNFIFDMLTRFVPGKIKIAKFKELSSKNSRIEKYYVHGENDFYNCIAKTYDDYLTLQQYFDKCGFSARAFTDSRSQYQYLNLSRLYDIIVKALDNGIKELTITAEPVKSSELHKHIFNQEFVNEIKDTFPVQNIKSKYAVLFGGKDGYFFDKVFVLEDIKNFVLNNIR